MVPVTDAPNAEQTRLIEDARRERNWKRWGPYLAERQWGTVREDYSADGDCWRYFPHAQARSRAYRWGEDGLLGITDRECRLCFAVALWNGRDPILKERLFGLGNHEGNHGEDVKECYFYLDATPTASYLKALYKYPQAEFPYSRLVEENRRRNRQEPEFELLDTGVFDDQRYFDVSAQYAKASPNDILIRITAANRGPEAATLDLLPTLWFRNTWSWGCTHEGCEPKPAMRQAEPGVIACRHTTLGQFFLHIAPDAAGRPAPLLFTDNETNFERLHWSRNEGPFVKDAFHDYLIDRRRDAVNPAAAGTKAAAHYQLNVAAHAEATVDLRLSAADEAPNEPFGPDFDRILGQRIAEADEFHRRRLPSGASDEDRQICRQAYAGLIWSRQFYHYVVNEWLDGDPAQPKPPARRQRGRNSDWRHLFNRDVISMPDKWEYPWYAAWDSAFHMIAMAEIDPQFAKEQLILFLREWYMHPSGQLPAYEFALNDVNPPVHAWACWRVYKMTARRGERDRLFLARVFQKLLINFTWWVNRKDVTGKHLFAGGFLGLDNVSLLDRSKQLPGGGTLEQADGTAWMAFYCVTMLAVAMELAGEDPAYEDVASKFFEHFVAIADAMNRLGGTGLWDECDGFYYDQLQADGRRVRLRIRSLVGLIPLIAVEILDDRTIARLPGFRKRLQWFLDNRRDLAASLSYMEPQGHCSQGRRLLAIPSRPRLERVLRYLLDESEFLSPFGVRSLSRVHKDHPYVCSPGGVPQRVDYEPAEATTSLYGGNSNWRGPVWLPVNYLLIEALERYHHFYGDALQVECPTGSGRLMNLRDVGRELALRVTRIFRPDEHGRRVCNGPDARWANDPHWRDLVLFYEYFNGDTGQGLGASHQTGWTALIARLLRDCCTSSGRQAGRLGVRDRSEC
ncbi:MAG: glucosidase [Thermoguttaceae bacterium]